MLSHGKHVVPFPSCAGIKSAPLHPGTETTDGGTLGERDGLLENACVNGTQITLIASLQKKNKI